MSKEEALKALRKPPPSKPAFTNDGKHLNLENHDLLAKIIQHKFKPEKETASLPSQVHSSGSEKEDE